LNNNAVLIIDMLNERARKTP